MDRRRWPGAGFAPDVVLLDLGLPGMDGYEVARRMRENVLFSGTKILVISGYASEEDRRRSKEAGVDEHLAKPVRVAELLQCVTGAGTGTRSWNGDAASLGWLSPGARTRTGD